MKAIQFTLSFIYLLAICQGALLLIGTESSNLYVLEFNEETGSVSRKNTTTIVQNPSFGSLHPNGQVIYFVSEVDSFNNQKGGGVAGYKLNRNTGGLTLINAVPTLGGSPAHVQVDETGQWVGVANYGGGNYGVWKIQSDFSLGARPVAFEQDTGKGPNPQQDGPHAHEFVFDPSNQFAVIPDLGTDSWMQYKFDAKTGALTPAAERELKAPSGAGPRHIAFHPTLPYAYGLSEIASTITVFSAKKPLTGLSIIQRDVHTLPTPQPSAAAELQFSPDGKFLYSSNRLTNKNGTIAHFSIDQADGTLKYIGASDTKGITPRHFTLSKNADFLIVANQVSNNLRVFKRDKSTGVVGGLVGAIEGLNQPSYILQI